MFSQLQNISWSKIAPEIRKKRMDEALHHLHTSVDLYEEQYRQGRYFLHEAPWAATSWKDPKVVELARSSHGQRADVQMGNASNRPQRVARNRLCEKGDRLDDEPSWVS